MNTTIQANMELPVAELAAAFGMSEEEFEDALMIGMITVKQEPAPPPERSGMTTMLQWRLTLGDKVVVMPIILRSHMTH
ncbi:MAG: hypothetical protein H7837_08820 [Magnetococcus sp. MYC-9]